MQNILFFDLMAAGTSRIKRETLDSSVYFVRDDDKKFINLSKQSTAQLAQVLSNKSNQSYIELRK